jgi:hypothetical protein
MPSDDLYRLVGVPADVPIERLRAAYEQAVAAATRGGDHQRALELSTAFDALPPSVKTQVYRNSRHGAGPVDAWYRSDAFATAPAGASRRPSGGPRRPSRATRRPSRGPGRLLHRGRAATPRSSARAGALLRRLLLLAAVALVTGLVVYLALSDGSGGSAGLGPALVRTR